MAKRKRDDETVAAEVESNNLLPPPAGPEPTIPITHWPPPMCGNCPQTAGKSFLPPSTPQVQHVCYACGAQL